MSEDNYGLTIPEGIVFQTMTSGDPNSTAPATERNSRHLTGEGGDGQGRRHG
jgi:hypothetical protein